MKANYFALTQEISLGHVSSVKKRELHDLLINIFELLKWVPQKWLTCRLCTTGTGVTGDLTGPMPS